MAILLRRNHIAGCCPSREFRDALKQARLKQGMSLKELARSIGTGDRVAQDLENADRRHQFQIVQSWARLFGYEVELVLTKRK